MDQSSNLWLTWSHFQSFADVSQRKHFRSDAVATYRRGRKQRSYLFIYQSCNWETIEAVCECLPQANVVPPFAFIIESINSVDGSTLVIPSEQEEVFRVFHLQEKGKDCASPMLWS